MRMGIAKKQCEMEDTNVKSKVSRLFFRLLFSYMVIILIPVLGLGVLSNYFFNYYNDELKAKQHNTVETIGDNLDLNINRLNSMGYMAKLNKAFSASYLQASYAQFYDTCKDLSVICYTNNFLDNIVYVNTMLKRVYTPDTQFSYSGFYHFGDSYMDFSQTDMETWLQGIDRDTWIPARQFRNRPGKAITYVKILRSYSENRKAFLAFYIGESTISKISGVSSGNPGECFLILDSSSGELLYASSPSVAEMVPDMQTFLCDTKDQSVDLSSKSYLAFYRDSAASPLRYVYIVSHEKFIEPVNRLQSILYICMGIICLLGICIIFLFMRKNYAPIRIVGKLAREHLPENVTNLDEMEAASLAITSISESNKLMQEQKLKIIKEQFLLSLLYGRYTDGEVLGSAMRETGVVLAGPEYQVTLVHFLNASRTEDIAYSVVTDYILSTMCKAVTSYAAEYSEDFSIVLMQSGSRDALEKARKMLPDIQSTLVNVISFDCIIGVSNTYTSLLETENSFRQAYAASRPLAHEGEHQQVVQFADLTQHTMNKPDIYPYDRLQALENAFMSGSREKIAFAVDVLLPSLNNMDSFFATMCLGYDMINVAMRALRRLNYPESSFYRKYPELLLRTNIKTPNEIVDIVMRIADEICQLVSRNAHSEAFAKDDRDIQEVLAFINHHYTDPSFSTKMLAYHLKMSVSNLSHYFKNKTGRVASEHINNLRFIKAKMLLRTTALPLNEIIQQSGYGHVNTLIRQFKQVEGMTPTEYRTLYSQKPAEVNGYENPYHEN